MAFQLYKPAGSSTAQTETYIATAAIAVGDVVKLVAGASGVGKGKVTKITGGADGGGSPGERCYGVAVSAATSSGTDEIQVIPIDPQQIWIADSAANTNANTIAARTTYIDTSMLVAVGGTITYTGNAVVTVGVVGATGDKKYLVKFTSSNLLTGGAAFTS